MGGPEGGGFKDRGIFPLTQEQGEVVEVNRSRRGSSSDHRVNYNSPCCSPMSGGTAACGVGMHMLSFID